MIKDKTVVYDMLGLTEIKDKINVLDIGKMKCIVNYISWPSNLRRVRTDKYYTRCTYIIQDSENCYIGKAHVISLSDGYVGN